MVSYPHPPRSSFEGPASLCEMLSGAFPTPGAKAQKNLGVKSIYQTLVNTGEKWNGLSTSLLSVEDSISRVWAALWADRESSPLPSHILAPDARFVLLHLLAQPRFGVFQFLFSLENRSISIDVDARESESSAEAGTSYPEKSLSSPPFIPRRPGLWLCHDTTCSRQHQTYSRTYYKFIFNTFKIVHTSTYLQNKVTGTSHRWRDWQRSRFNHHLTPAEQSQKAILVPTCPGVFQCPTSRNKPWKAKDPSPPPHPGCYTQVWLLREWPKERSQSLTTLGETAQPPQPQKKFHSLHVQSSTMQQQASASHWESPSLATLRGWRDAAAPLKNHAQLLNHMSYSQPQEQQEKTNITTKHKAVPVT